MTVYEFANKCMADKEFNNGGIVTNEREYLDAVGFEYTVSRGCVSASGPDLAKFYEAMETLRDLNIKYKGGFK